MRDHLIIKNPAIVRVGGARVIREYVPGRFGYVYQPAVVVEPVIVAAWSDPFWYGGPGIAVETRQFSFSWGWDSSEWYVHRCGYWEPAPIYPSPAYWANDYVMAGYMADRYAVATSVEQTQKEIELARLEAESARAAAAAAADEAERAQELDLARKADFRVQTAEKRLALAQTNETSRAALGDRPSPKAAPLGEAERAQLVDQFKQAQEAEKRYTDEKAAGREPVPADLMASIASPDHIYLASKELDVTRADNDTPAGKLKTGDTLKIAPGQEEALKNASESSSVKMRVVNANGDDDEVAAGSVINLSMKNLQEFDSEFRAKVHEATAITAQNNDKLKSLVTK